MTESPTRQLDPDQTPTQRHPPSPAPPADDSKTPQADTTTTAQAPESDLTAIRAHYLKKALVSLQFDRELDVLTNPSHNPSVSILSYLGKPFKPVPRDDPDPPDLVFSRFIFRQFCLTFPFLASAPKDFFPNKLQPFIDSVIARNLTGFGAELERTDGDEGMRKKALKRAEKQLSLLMGSAIKLTEKEEVVRLTQYDLDRLERLAKRNLQKSSKVKEKFEINVIGVRVITERKHLRNRVHEEFIIRTKRPGRPDVHVSRRSGDFKTLAAELRKAHPEEEVRPPPQKDHSTTRSTVSTPVTPSYTPNLPYSRTPTPNSSESLPMTPTSSVTSPTPSAGFARIGLQREKNRLTLRAYLNTLLTSPVLASSPVLRSFLLDGPIKLSAEEVEDARRREEADRIREEGKARFEQAIKDRVETLRDAMKNVQSDMLGKDGLTRIFATIRATSSVRDLPPDYHAVIEWGRISLASTLFHHLVASDSSSETIGTVKRLHGLMPYTLLKGILKISNPIAMVRGILDLFLAQPFGGKSLLQRMFTTSLTEEVRALQEDIEAVGEKVDDPVICEKVRLFVQAPREIQGIYRADAAENNVNLLTVILRSGETPQLSRAQLQRVARASRAHATYLKKLETLDSSDSDEGPQDEDGWLYEDLGVLLRMYGRLRDRQQLIALIFEGTTAELFKDIITIFYSPLAQVYKAASIGDSLSDLQSFVNDLIRTVDFLDETNQADPARTVQTFIDLVERHEQAFYTFVHKVHSKGEGLFDSLMRWIEVFLTFVREGLGENLSLEFLLPHHGEQRTKILEEVDQLARYHYKLKVAHEEKVKRRFGKGKMDAVAAAEDEAAQALVDGVMNELSFGDLLHSDAADIVSDTSSDEVSSLESETEESGSEETDSDEDEDEDEEFCTPSSAVDTHNPFFTNEPERTQTTQPSIANGQSAFSSQTSSRSASLPHSLHSHHKEATVTPQSAASNSYPSSTTSSQRHSDETRRNHSLHIHPHIHGHRLHLHKQHREEPSTTPTRSKTIQETSDRRQDTAKVTPAKQASLQSPASKNLHVSIDPTAAPSKKAAKKPTILKEPELVAIPELLPLFIEMIRPRLRPRPV